MSRWTKWGFGVMNDFTPTHTKSMHCAKLYDDPLFCIKFDFLFNTVSMDVKRLFWLLMIKRFDECMNMVFPSFSFSNVIPAALSPCDSRIKNWNDKIHELKELCVFNAVLEPFFCCVIIKSNIYRVVISCWYFDSGLKALRASKKPYKKATKFG